LTAQGESLNRYGFFVDRKANKLQIKQAIKDLYGLKSKSISTMIVLERKRVVLPRAVLFQEGPLQEEGYCDIVKRRNY